MPDPDSSCFDPPSPGTCPVPKRNRRRWPAATVVTGGTLGPAGVRNSQGSARSSWSFESFGMRVRLPRRQTGGSPICVCRGPIRSRHAVGSGRAELRKDIRALQSELRAGQAELREDLEALGVRLAVVEQRADALETRFAVVERRTVEWPSIAAVLAPAPIRTLRPPDRLRGRCLLVDARGPIRGRSRQPPRAVPRSGLRPTDSEPRACPRGARQPGNERSM